MGRGVAQSGSAPALGAGGPQFESGRPDYVAVKEFTGMVTHSVGGHFLSIGSN